MTLLRSGGASLLDHFAPAHDLGWGARGQATAATAKKRGHIVSSRVSRGKPLSGTGQPTGPTDRKHRKWLGFSAPSWRLPGSDSLTAQRLPAIRTAAIPDFG
jgi:hypothetical protein